jgi:hypothetical protein
MPTEMADWSPATVVAVLAVAFYALGFLFRRQDMLRLLVLIGSGLYILYYFIAGPEPLWDAILGTGAIALANLYGLVGLLVSRSRLTVRGEDRELLDAFGPLEPGLFRRLMRAGQVIRPEDSAPMTAEGERPDALWFVFSGRVRIEKFGRAATISGPCFIGEIAWMRGIPATATTMLLPGATAARWPRARLERALRRSPRLATALEALVAQDLAQKVAAGQPRIVELGIAPEGPGRAG